MKNRLCRLSAIVLTVLMVFTFSGGTILATETDRAAANEIEKTIDTESVIKDGSAPELPQEMIPVEITEELLRRLEGVLPEDTYALYLDGVSPQLQKLMKQDEPEGENQKEEVDDQVAAESKDEEDADKISDTISFELSEDGELVLSGSGIIPEAAFANRKDIKKVVIENGITGIARHAFLGCSLEAIEVPKTVKTIDEYAFYGCQSLNTIHIPDGVKRIKAGTFGLCTALNVIELPASVNSIEAYAFADSGICQMTLLGVKPPKLDSTAFEDTHYLGYIYVSTRGYHNYLEEEGWESHLRLSEEEIAVGYDNRDVFPLRVLNPMRKVGKTYYIENEEQFYHFIYSISEGHTYANEKVILSTDVDMKDVEFADIWNTDKTGGCFSGYFNGDHHCIYNFKDTNDMPGSGLFRSISGKRNAQIENLRFEQVAVDEGIEGIGCGVLAGYAEGNVTISDITVEGGSIKGCDYVGGLIGQARVQDMIQIQDCVVKLDTLQASHMTAGGLLGCAVGRGSVTLDRCQSLTKHISGVGYTGGIVGSLAQDSSELQVAISNCSTDENGEIVSDLGYAGGIVGAICNDRSDHELIQNVNAATVQVRDEGEASEKLYSAGGIIGYAEGGANFIQNVNEGDVFTTEKDAGGIAGEIDDGPAIFDQCKNYGKVVAGARAGGILGTAGNYEQECAFAFHSCENSGEIVSSTADAGGITGAIWSYIDMHLFQSCQNTGSVNGLLNAGGMVGIMEGAGSLEDCYNEGEIISLESYAGGMVGEETGHTCMFTDCVSTGQLQGYKDQGLLCGYDASRRANIDGVSFMENGSMWIIIGGLGIVVLIIIVAVIVTFQRTKQGKQVQNGEEEKESL